MRINKLKLIAIASTILLSGCASIKLTGAENETPNLDDVINNLRSASSYTRETTLYFSDYGWDHVKDYNRFIDGFSRESRTTIFANNSLYMYATKDSKINSGYYSPQSGNGLYHYTLNGGVDVKDSEDGSLIEKKRTDSTNTNAKLFFPTFSILNDNPSPQTGTKFASLFEEGEHTDDYFVWTASDFEQEVATSKDLNGKDVSYTLEDFVEGFAASCYSCSYDGARFIEYEQVNIKINKTTGDFLMELYALEKDAEKVSGPNGLFAIGAISAASLNTVTLDILNHW